uniref:Thioredoxin domain-containing protein n=1 Tax=Clastoptera arizonana TaxID=38151 RepID=A0A1B6CN15_9HEMI
MAVRVINDESHFQSELASSSTKLVVVDFTATWCMPCQRISPIFEQLAIKYNEAVFLKVDVDRCQETAAAQEVSVMPTFIFYRNRTKLARIQGANPTALEDKIKQFYGALDEAENPLPGLQKGIYMDLTPFIMTSQCEALNESDTHPFAHCLTNTEGQYLESDCDEQLILSFTFTQAVKIHSIKVKGPAGNGPKTIKLFINQPNTLDFDSASVNQAVQEITLTENELQGIPVGLRFVKFQNVQNLQIFIEDNQSAEDTTRIDYLQLIGTPIVTTNMNDFKRVTGKKGEAH